MGVEKTRALAAEALLAPLASPALTGTPTVPTQSFADNSTEAVNSAWVNGQGYQPIAAFSAQQVYAGPVSGGSAALPSARYLTGNDLFGCVNYQTATSYVVQSGDQGCLIVANGGSTSSWTIPSANAPGFACAATKACFTTVVTNDSAFQVTLTPTTFSGNTSTIDGAASVP